ncbi:methyltransferase family protein [Novosphingobium sp. 9]|uniref:methyltransferase family protein n=1 Tax=Novosphingobium sp. 9 TaxID=2025349 RepID=UPI0021B55281|nr:DUF1295 domain-containing protein [Novosphingobium sp. 9]
MTEPSFASPAPTSRPVSDVSPGVGLSGVVALIVWVLVCRNWPTIGEALHLPGPRAVLSGPYAALASVFFTTTTMALWSVLVDKVHYRPSTGLDWTNPRPLSQAMETAVTKLAGLWATWAVIGFYYCIGRWYWDGQYVFAMDVLGAVAVPLFVLSIPYVLWLERYMIEPRDHAWHFGAMLIGREAWEADEVKKHARAWAIKAFFGAFMISILPGGFAGVVEADFGQITRDPVMIGTALINLLFTVDVQIGTVGYLCTFRPLDAHIRSGNPLLAGWVAALMCYPPFVMATMGNAQVLAYEVNTGGWVWALQGHTALLWLWAGVMVVLTAIYAWATFAFGIRFSNLTYRGVLTNGPYRFTRHPAYLSKNLFWWLSALPFAVNNHSLTDMVRNTVLLGVVSGIYYWRARTEEAHLLAEDPKYRAYHAWMSENALITRTLGRIAGLIRPRSGEAQAAE